MSLPSDGAVPHRSRDIFELIEDDHRRIQSVLNQLTVAEAIPDWRPSHRRKVVQRLVMEESRHEVAEEEFFWPAVRETLDRGADLRRAGVLQEQRAKQLLRALDREASRAPGGDDAADRQLADLIDEAARAIRDHVRFEELQVIPPLRRELDDVMSHRLGSWYQWGVERAPTRPHPHTPPMPGVLRTTGRLAAATDRIRDLVTRRGKG